ncbi:transcriptional regulator [Nocardia sp. SYP-A9097]|uniref:SRPBCC family protein n=1 Tax=Nocardia sp. SYP-A9097 TaxID=2663237 RepID=UPI00129A9EB4|nr:SRPBCC family protein [Nocardia sp. SYP-A9097]MRH87104.1 transcriptional regulator [Nocardia sp. SYP-A9097]
MTEFDIVRDTVIKADPARIQALVDDFHQWQQWSPWEGLDPTMERTYSGADRGIGARYFWSGNRKAGRGDMEITSATSQAIGIRLNFEKPIKNTNQVTFEFIAQPEGTAVSWRMTGERTGMMALMAKVLPMDRMVGKDFEKGLAQLKAAAEG